MPAAIAHFQWNRGNAWVMDLMATGWEVWYNPLFPVYSNPALGTSSWFSTGSWNKLYWEAHSFSERHTLVDRDRRHNESASVTSGSWRGTIQPFQHHIIVIGQDPREGQGLFHQWPVGGGRANISYSQDWPLRVLIWPEDHGQGFFSGGQRAWVVG